MNNHSDQFEITALPENAGIVRERVKAAAKSLGFTRYDLDDIEIAVGEAITNAILYGSPSATSRIVVLTFTTETDPFFHVEIRDQGQGFDPHAIREEAGTDALGGRGVRLMRALMDEVDLHYNGNGMTVRLSKRLPG